jgi:hypothetical protein
VTVSKRAAANRRNAQRSTGPRTPAGKAVVARNAVRHGAFALLPVVPGMERAEDWEAHRAGILASLAPAGALEICLAERAALLLWRLARVARYETAAVAVALDEAADEAAPPPPDPFPSPYHRDTDAERLHKARAELEKKRGFLADAQAGLDAAGRLEALPDDAPLSYPAAFAVFEAAYNELPEKHDCPMFEDEEFLAELGQPEDESFDRVPWTAGLVRRGLAVIAGHARYPPERMADRWLRELQEHRDGLSEKVAELAAEVKALERRRRVLVVRKQAGLTLPAAEAEGKVLRYEGHLSRQLFQTLHELERLQAGRAGRPVVPPPAVDVGGNAAGSDPGSP